MSQLNNIRAVLEERLSAISGIPDIAFANVAFAEVIGTPWVRCRVDALSRRLAGVSSAAPYLYEGIMTVDLFYPEKEGAGEAIRMADLIIDTFDQRGLFLEVDGTITRIRYAEPQPGITDPPWYMIPVTVGWMSYSAE